jgi:hypothetical protein
MPGDTMTDDEIRQHIKRLRMTAEAIGAQHALWELIFDAEALLSGRRTLLPRQYIEQMLSGQK